MKVGIISDSHDNKEKIIEAVKVFNKENVGYVIHAGDIISPFTYREFKNLTAPMFVIYGNNDGEKFGLQKVFNRITEPPAEISIDNRNFLVLHAPRGLEAFKSSGIYDYIVYGHTHIIEVSMGETTVINPGEACGWITGRYTVAVLDLETGKVEIVDI
ncbi:YfcE family phosphodiesterase, partial [candidate division KSB1 bacterium]